MAMINVVTINGVPVVPVPAGGFGNYVESGHGSVLANARTIAALLQSHDIGDGQYRGDRLSSVLPNSTNTARYSQSIFHVHVSAQDADQIFFNWTFQAGTLAINRSAPITHP